MSNDKEHDYTATGPTDIGFRTDGTRIENGVVAFGNQIGVKGISVGGEKGPFFCGVFGESHDGIGVQGKSENMAGVIGISGGADGVKGFGGKQGSGVNGFCDPGVGVRGESIKDDESLGIEWRPQERRLWRPQR